MLQVEVPQELCSYALTDDVLSRNDSDAAKSVLLKGTSVDLVSSSQSTYSSKDRTEKRGMMDGVQEVETK